MNKIEKHAQICKELNELYARKNADYGDSFGKSFTEYGMLMPCLRLEDKLNRIKSLTKQAAQVSDESIVDTLMDLANYSIMTLVELAQGASEKAQKHSADCVTGLFPDCQCLTCARDHGHTVEERGCCMVLGKRCRINNCPDYVKEE